MQEKFFIRSEALVILSGIISKQGMPRMLAIADAIQTAQAFEEQMQLAGLSDHVILPNATAEIAYGDFLPYDDLLYFQSNDGSRFLIGKYASMQIATAMAIAFNSFLSESGFEGQAVRRPSWSQDNNSGIDL